MKKTISLFLSALMLLSVLTTAPFSAFAKDVIEMGEIKLDETVSAELTDREIARFSFVAPESRYYEFSASNEYSFTVNIKLTDESGTEVGKASILKNYAELTAGKTYYADVFFPFTDVFGTVKLNVKNHEHAGSKNTVQPTCKKDGSYKESCSYCGYYKTEVLPKGPEHHVFEYGKCRLCGAKDKDFQSRIVPLTQDVPVSGEITYRAEKKYYSFIPSADGLYEFSTTGNYLGTVAVYNEEWSCLKSNSQKVIYTLEGGKTYYISYTFQYYNETNYTRLGSFSITASIHEHNYQTSVVQKATCVSEGKKRISCSDIRCNDSYEEVIPIDPDAHLFTDNVCQRCGYTNPDYQAPSVTLEDNVEADLTSENASTVYWYYTAEEDGLYYINFRYDIRTVFYYKLYDSKGNSIIDETQNSITNNKLKTELEGGKTYTLELKGDGNSAHVWVKIVKHNHTLHSYVKKEATCVSNGERRTYCTDYCGYDVTESIPATGVHAFANGKCKYCDAIDETYVKTVKTLAEGEEVSVEPSVSGEESYYDFTPLSNGIYCFTVVKSATGSGMNTPTVLVYDDFNESVKPFYTNTPSYYKYDTRYYNLDAGKKYSITVKVNNVLPFVLSMSAHEHEYRSNGYTPRCNQYVTATFTCSCNDKYNVVYEPSEHIFAETVYAPTCVENGYSEMKCKGCGLSYKYGYTPVNPEAHIFKNGICTECGAYEHEEDKPVLKTNTLNSFTMYGEDDEIIAYFIPGETDYYYFRSTEGYDVYAELYDSDYNCLAEDDDNGGRYDFRMAARLEANKEYIILIGNYEDFEEDITGGSFTFNVICGKHSHSYSAEVVAPTETTKGFTYYECACGDYYIDNVKEPTGQSQESNCEHNYVKYQTEAPTCIDEGYTLYYCTKCYDIYTADITPPTGVHKYSGNYCMVCGERKPRNETGENYVLTTDVPTEVAIASINERIFLSFTPEESGIYLFNTRGTYDIYALLYDKDGKELCRDAENSGAGNNAQIACEMTAGEEYKFELQLNSGSNAVFTAFITKHSHDFADYIVPATCGEDGIGIHTCKTCFYSYQDVPEKATGNHDFDEKGVCKSCGYSDDAIVAIPISDFNNITVPAFEDYVIYSFTAPHSGTLTIEGHSNGITMGVLLSEDMKTFATDNGSGEGMNFRLNAEVTAGANYYLAVSGLPREYEVSLDFKAEHSYELIDTVLPTCTQQGYSVYKCTLCGNINKSGFEDAKGHTPAAATRENEKPAACTKAGSYEEVIKCSVCGEELSRDVKSVNATGHTPAAAIRENTVAATYDKEGSYDSVVYCSVCSAEISRKNVNVDKLKKTSLAKATVTGIKDKVYTEKALTQSVTVKLGSKTLKNGTDYKVSYKNNKNVGKATVTITGINAYSGAVTKTFAINPKGTSLSGLTAKSKGFTVKWKKQTAQTTGYEVQYSTDKNFKKGLKTATVTKNSTVSKAISKLTAKKKYYVRIRTYKTVSGKKYYSTWSSAKSVTTKK